VTHSWINTRALETMAGQLRDFYGLRRNLRRLAHVAATAERRWQEHEATCVLCATDDPAADLCAEGLALFTRAEAYTCALWTARGRMTWE